jgi:uncharacterized protein (TIGR03437 family)
LEIPAAYQGVWTGMVSQTPDIGGVAIPQDNILFAGLTPEFAGLYQINLTLPASLPPGTQEVVLRQASAGSRRGVTIAID